jgi:arabinogalactan oligomer/maltooligosaccharide transport system substrate-binding protein
VESEFAVIARPAIAQRVAGCMLLTLLLTACAAAAAPSSPDPTAPAGAARSSVTLVLWHGWSNAARQALSRLVEQFNRQHPDGQVILQSVPLATFDADLRGALAAGSGPHVVLLPNTWVGSLAEQGALLPLDGMLAPADWQPLLPAAMSGARARDRDGQQRLYALPVSFDTLALYYDKRNVLTPPADTAALLQTAHGLGAPDATPPLWGLALNLSLENTIGYLYAAGGRIFDDKGKVVLGGAGRPGAEQWLSWLAQLKDDKQLLVRADSSIQIDRELKDGHVLMTFDWSHQLGFYRSLWADKLGIAPLPRLSATNQPPEPYVRSDVLAINSRASAAERQAAVEFLRFMVGAEAQRALLKSDLQPARTDLKLDGQGLDSVQIMAAQAFRSQAAQGRPMPNAPAPEREALRRELAQMQRQVLRGEASPAAAVTEADENLHKQLGSPNP